MPLSQQKIASTQGSKQVVRKINGNAHENDCEPEQSSSVFQKPSRALTTYNFFFKAHRLKLLKIKELTGKGVTFAEMARQISKLWNASTEAEKEPYKNLAAGAKADYRRKMVLWRKAQRETERRKEDVLPGNNQEASLKLDTTREAESVAETEDRLDLLDLQPSFHTSIDTTNLKDLMPAFNQQQYVPRQPQPEQIGSQVSWLEQGISGLQSVLPINPFQNNQWDFHQNQSHCGSSSVGPSKCQSQPVHDGTNSKVESNLEPLQVPSSSQGAHSFLELAEHMGEDSLEFFLSIMSGA